MSANATAYLVIRREDGFGDVFPLTPGESCTLGRAATNRIVLKDDLCSREHAEVSFSAGRWRLRDLSSLNGTRLNSTPVEGEKELSPRDEINVGRTALLFIEAMTQLPDVSLEAEEPNGLAIKKRLGNTRYLTPPTPLMAEDSAQGDGQTVSFTNRHPLSRDLSLLYRLALDMGAASTYDELCRIVLDALLEAIPAEVGAVLSVARPADGSGRPPTARLVESAIGKSLRNTDLEVTAYRHRDPSVRGYSRVSEYVSKEVLALREAILAEDVARDRFLRVRESLTDIGATSLICAPVLFNDKVLGLMHLYCTDPKNALDSEDLEFAVAVAKQLGIATHQMLRQQSLARRTVRSKTSYASRAS